MIHVLVDHKVKDYVKWKPIFDKSLPMVKKAGGKKGQLFRLLGNPNHVFVCLEWDNKETAKKFMASEDLMKAFQESGVIGTPIISMLDKIEDVKL